VVFPKTEKKRESREKTYFENKIYLFRGWKFPGGAFSFSLNRLIYYDLN